MSAQSKNQLLAPASVYTRVQAPMPAQHLNLSVGDHAVLPCHGVGEVVAIASLAVAGVQERFYRMRMAANGAHVMIPSHRLRASRLRLVIPAWRVAQIFTLLRRPAVAPSGSNWTKWFRVFDNKLQSGSILGAAEVLRDLFELKQTKSLSPGERRMFDKATVLVVTELSCATGEEESEIEIRVQAALTHATRKTGANK